MMKFLSTMLYAFFILMLLSMAGLFLATLLPSEYAKYAGNMQVKIVKSGSMAPAIPTGSVVIVKPQASYALGDVITFGEDTARKIPTTHRIVEIRGDFNNTLYMTKGDANEEADPVQVSEKDVIGKIVFSLPYAGYVLDFARQPIGFTLMIGVPAAIIIVDELARIWSEVKALRSGARWRRGVRAAARAALPRTRRRQGSDEKYEYTVPLFDTRTIDGIHPRRHDHV